MLYQAVRSSAAEETAFPLRGQLERCFTSRPVSQGPLTGMGWGALLPGERAATRGQHWALEPPSPGAQYFTERQRQKCFPEIRTARAKFTDLLLSDFSLTATHVIESKTRKGFATPERV